MVKMLAASRGITMRRLARELDFAEPSFNDRLGGRRRWQAEEIRDLARYFDVSTDELLGLRPVSVGFESAWMRTHAGLRIAA